jgi:hypothetical protein
MLRLSACTILTFDRSLYNVINTTVDTRLTAALTARTDALTTAHKRLGDMNAALERGVGDALQTHATATRALIDTHVTTTTAMVDQTAATAAAATAASDAAAAAAAAAAVDVGKRCDAVAAATKVQLTTERARTAAVVAAAIADAAAYCDERTDGVAAAIDAAAADAAACRGDDRGRCNHMYSVLTIIAWACYQSINHSLTVLFPSFVVLPDEWTSLINAVVSDINGTQSDMNATKSDVRAVAADVEATHDSLAAELLRQKREVCSATNLFHFHVTPFYCLH